MCLLVSFFPLMQMRSNMNRKVGLGCIFAWMLFGLTGCGGEGSNGASPAGSARTVATATEKGSAGSSVEVAPKVGSGEVIDNLDYLSWKPFKPGTTVVRKKESKNEKGWVKETTTWKLKELTPEKVIIESQITVERPDEPAKVNPPFEIAHSARFTVPKNMKKEQFNKPSLRAVEVGEESITVAGKTYKARLFTWEDQTESGPMPQKLWLSAEVPGRFLKQASAVTKDKTNRIETNEELVEIKLP